MNSFLGFVTLGSSLLGYLLTKNGDVPTAADALPTYRVYGPSGLMTNGTGAVAAGDQTAIYKLTHSIASADGFVAGQTYSIRVAYTIGGAAKGQVLTFTVV